jgi:hypothetical protein
MQNLINIRIWKERHFQINVTAPHTTQTAEPLHALEPAHPAGAPNCAAPSDAGTALLSQSCDTAHFVRA